MARYCSLCERKLKEKNNTKDLSPCCHYPIVDEGQLRGLKGGAIPNVKQEIPEKSKLKERVSKNRKAVDPSSGIRKGTAKLACYLLWKSNYSVSDAIKALTAKGHKVGSSSVRSWYNRFRSRYGESNEVTGNKKSRKASGNRSR